MLHPGSPRRSALWRAAGLAGVLLAALPARALDFRLEAKTVEEDGFSHEQWSFANDARSRVIIRLPAGWNHADDAGSLTLTPPNVTNGMVKLEKSSVGPGTAFQDKGLEVYRQRLLTGIPQGAVGAKLTAETADPLPIFGWKSREFTADYEFFGQSYRRSVLFINLNAREQLVVTTVSPKADFERVHGAGYEVLRSWQTVPVP